MTDTAPAAFVTGITGQDGAYLAQLLLDKGYRVAGGFRRTSTVNFWRLDELGIRTHPRLSLVEHDVTDLGGTIRLLTELRPDEVYNLAAQSFVGVSFQSPVATAEATGIGALNVLEAIRIVDPSIRFYQASSSEMFGKVHAVPQCESTTLHPRSPYGVAKVFAHYTTVNYRESYGLFAASGILFNHESPLRGSEFVTRKITEGIARLHAGAEQPVELGNMDAKRDWGFAGEYVDGMWRMLHASAADTFVLATGRASTVREFATMSAAAAEFDVEWSGSAEQETGTCRTSGRCLFRVNPKFYRPAEVDLLIGDASKARAELGWAPRTTLEELCQMMVESDLRRTRARALA